MSSRVDVVAGAIGSHHTATTDGSWDGPGAVAGMPNDAATLRYCHAWVDSSGDPDAKGSYKFPHHTKKGGPANLNGVRNGLARLEGAHIPDGDRNGVEAHLRAHLRDGGGGGDGDGDSTQDSAGLARLLRDRRNVLGASRPRPLFRDGLRDWYRVQNATDETPDETTVWIYDEISYCGVTADAFARDLAAIDTPVINLRLNSPGGDVFDGIAIYNSLVNHPAQVRVFVDGLAASAASVIAMAGDTITMGKGSQLMVHDGLALCIGNEADHRLVADLLDKCSNEIAGFYASRAGGSVDEWRTIMRGEAWYTGEEAVTAGLADSVASPKAPPREVPQNSWDLSVFRFSGRECAPDPITVRRDVVAASPAVPPETSEPEPASFSSRPVFDAAAFRQVVDSAFRRFNPELFREALR